MSQQPEEVIAEEVTAEDDFNEAGEFGEDEQPEKTPFWKREILFGYSLPWLLGAAFLLAAGGWFIFGTSHGSGTTAPSDAAFSEVEHALGNAGGDEKPTIHPGTASAATPDAFSPTPAVAAPADTLEMMKDIRDELNAREERMNASIRVLQESISQLSDAIKRDEAYAVETRNLLTAVTEKLAGLETRQPSTAVAAVKGSTARRKTPSPIAGMHVVSLEKGMAWIKWQGSTWAVREGEQLGKVTINRIDPATRSIQTTGGVLR